jgi:hypothetical protein
MMQVLQAKTHEIIGKINKQINKQTNGKPKLPLAQAQRRRPAPNRAHMQLGTSNNEPTPALFHRNENRMVKVEEQKSNPFLFSLLHEFLSFIG